MKRTVLVIGAGGAGLTAAICAARRGADVYVVSKSSAGKNTATIYSGGIFRFAGGSLTPDAHFAKTMEIGQHANDAALVRVLADEAESSIHSLCSLGINIRFPSDGIASVRHTSAHKLMAGEGFMAQMCECARSHGVRFIDFSTVTRLLTDERRIVGAELVNWQTHEACIFHADAVILATGGGGQIFSRTDNPSRLTGDGYALASDVGLSLIGMEFTQFYPLGWSDPALPVWMADLGLIDFLPLTDSDGREFLLEQLRSWGLNSGQEGNLFARDRSAIAIARAARNGGAWLHFERADAPLWENKTFIRALIIDKAVFRKLDRPVRVEPLEHYFCGGVKIDAECRTGIEGLYACGEVTGGVDGANRIGGNALANIVTFGSRAGKNAADGTAYSVPERCTRTDAPRFDGTTPAGTLRKRIQETMWRCAGPLRTAEGLGEALSVLDECEHTAVSADSTREYLEALELHGMITTSRAVAKGAINRKESLGVHCRED